jgi:hypothetical protein
LTGVEHVSDKTYVSNSPAKTAKEQSLTHRSIDIDSESSTRVKLLANGVFGRGPKHPAKEKEAPLSETTSVGPGKISLVVVVVGGSKVDSTAVVEVGGGTGTELLLLISGTGVVENSGGEFEVGGCWEGDIVCETGPELLDSCEDGCAVVVAGRPTVVEGACDSRTDDSNMEDAGVTGEDEPTGLLSLLGIKLMVDDTETSVVTPGVVIVEDEE